MLIGITVLYKSKKLLAYTLTGREAQFAEDKRQELYDSKSNITASDFSPPVLQDNNLLLVETVS